MANVTDSWIRQQLQDLYPEARLLIVHPNYRSQHLLIHPLLLDDGCIYMRLDGHNLTQHRLKEALELAIVDQLPGGSVTDVRRLIVDEWDRANAGDLESFLRDLAPRIGKGCIILMGRGMPEFVHNNPDLRQKTRFVPTNRSLMCLDYSQNDGKTALLEVYAFGNGAVMVNGRLIEDWAGDLPRSLFFYLVDRGIATRNDIFKAFWPELSVKEATNVFHVTKRKISEVLGIDLTTYWSGFYRISPRVELVYDVALFSEAVQDSAVLPTHTAQQVLSDAIRYYRGDYLESLDITISWVGNRRADLRQTCGEALINLAKLLEQGGELKQALGLYIRAFATNSKREDVAGSIMRIYAALGLYADALSIYKRLETELLTQLNISPARSLQRLVADIQEKAADRVLV